MKELVNHIALSNCGDHPDVRSLRIADQLWAMNDVLEEQAKTIEELKRVVNSWEESFREKKDVSPENSE
jgi:hypothetical protein